MTDTASAAPVAWRVHPFDYGIGHQGVYAMTMLEQQRDAWLRKGWKVEPLYVAPRAAMEPLTDEQIEKLRRDTFSTENPFCPCDSKTMRKAVWATERAHGIGIKKENGNADQA